MSQIVIQETELTPDRTVWQVVDAEANFVPRQYSSLQDALMFALEYMPEYISIQTYSWGAKFKVPRSWQRYDWTE